MVDVRPPLLRSSRLAQALKRVAVTAAVVFFAAVAFLWWALRTGRAVEYVRTEIVSQARTACGVSLGFEALRLDALPPVVSLNGVVIDDQASGTRFASVREAIVELEVLPILYGRIQIDRAALLEPTATLVVRGSTLANLPRCLVPDPDEEATVPIVLGVRELRVERGKLDVIVPGSAEVRAAEIDISLTPSPGGGAELAVAVQGSTLTLAAATVPVPRVRLLAHVAGALTSPRALSIEHLDVEALGGKLGVSGSVDLLGPVYEARVALALPLEALPPLWAQLPPMRGRLELEGGFAGTLTEPRGFAKVVLSGAHIDNLTVADRVTVEARATRSQVELSSLKVELGEGHAVGAGSISLTDGPRLSLDLEVVRLPFARLLSCLDIQSAWIDWAADGTVSASGTLSPLALGGDVDVRLDRFRVWDRGWDRPEIRAGGDEHLLLALGPTTVDGTWTADPAGFWIKDARIVRGTTTGTATARVNVDDLAGLTVDGRFDPFDFSDLGPIAGVPLTGRGVVDAHVAAPTGDIGGWGQLALAGVTVADIPLGDARSDVRWQGTTVFLDGLSALLSRSQYAADVKLDFEPAFTLAARGRITDGRLEDVLLPFHWVPEEWGRPEGAMTGTFDVAGPLRQLDGVIAGKLQDVVLYGERFDRGAVEIHMERGVLAFDTIDLVKRGATVAGQARIDPALDTISAQLASAGLTLQKLDVMQAGTQRIDGPLGLVLDLGGTLTSLTGTLTASFGAGRAGELVLPPGKLVGRFRQRSLDITGALLGGALGVVGTVELSDGLPYRSALTLTDYDVPRLVSALRGEGAWTGQVSGSAELSGKLRDWAESTGTVLLDKGRFDPLQLELVGPAKLTLAAGVATTKRLAVQGPSTRLTGVGSLGRTSDLRVQGRVDLGNMPQFFPQVEQSGGVLTLDAVLRGQGAELDLLGTGRVDRGLLEWRGIPGRLSNASAQLTFSRATVLIEGAEGRYADGDITASGEVTLLHMLPESIRLEMNLAAVRPRLVYTKFDLIGTLSGPLVMEGTFTRLGVRGQLAASRATLRPKLDWRSLIDDPTRRLAPQVYDPDKEVMTFDVGVSLTADDPLKVRNDTAELEMYGEVSLTGTNQRVGMLGALTMGRGRVGFIGREYTMLSGTMELRDRYVFAPHYDLQLGARACDAQITLNLVGTLDAVSTTYASKPEMEDSNIVSCLIRGVRVRDIENIRGDNRGSAAASLAGEALWRLSGVDQEVRKVLPVDQIEVTTEYSARDRVYEPRILVAKELGDGRFRLEYSSSLVKNDEQRAAVRYRITPELTLQYTWASSDDITVGDHGVDLKYRWEW